VVTHATSTRPPPVNGQPKNRLLASLPADDLKRILPHLETIAMTVKQVVHKRGEPLHHVFFPNGGVFSITSMMIDGTAIEVATVGSEGMLGAAAFFGGNTMPGETMLQVLDSTAERMDLASFASEIERRGAFYDAVGRYAQGMLALVMQSTACIGLHHVHERCCRWLLMTRDRVGSDHFDLSHEFLAMMLGTTRPTVSIVAGTLQHAGLIRYTHGHMTIVDRDGLEAASCECYATIKAEFARLNL
jgi:CRP-like cAMP-binding protein